MAEDKTLLYIVKENAITEIIQIFLAAKLPDLKFKSISSLEEGRIFVEQNQPDVILLDWEFPEFKSEEFLAWIKSEELLKNIPVIVEGTFSSYRQSYHRGDPGPLIIRGADRIFMRPIAPAELVEALNKII